jgi:predicted nucleic acid-binding protein
VKVLVDTSVWSLALRRKTRTKQEQAIVYELEELLKDAKVVMLGIIRLELLCGVADKRTFRRLRDRLLILDDEEVVPEDYVQAADFYNTCRSNGIQGSSVDYMLCALAARNDWCIFTTDKDFFHYARYIPIKLYKY